MKRMLLLFTISGFMGISGANTPCIECDADLFSKNLYDTIIPADTLEAIKERAVNKAITKQLRKVDSLKILRDSLAVEYRHLRREMKKKNLLEKLMNGRQRTAVQFVQSGITTGIQMVQ